MKDGIYSIDELQTCLTPIFQKYGVKRAVLFGSYGKGTATANSDIDLMVDSGLKGLRFVGIKMMFMTDEIVNEHYAHLKERPFFPYLKASMQAAPIIACCLEGAEAVETVRLMVGATNSRKALPGTIRGDFSMSGEQNVVHASDSVENAQIEINRFFKEGELFDYNSAVTAFEYGGEESIKFK